MTELRFGVTQLFTTPAHPSVALAAEQHLHRARDVARLCHSGDAAQVQFHSPGVGLPHVWSATPGRFFQFSSSSSSRVCGRSCAGAPPCRARLWAGALVDFFYALVRHCRIRALLVGRGRIRFLSLVSPTGAAILPTPRPWSCTRRSERQGHIALYAVYHAGRAILPEPSVRSFRQGHIAHDAESLHVTGHIACVNPPARVSTRQRGYAFSVASTHGLLRINGELPLRGVVFALPPGVAR